MKFIVFIPLSSVAFLGFHHLLRCFSLLFQNVKTCFWQAPRHTDKNMTFLMCLEMWSIKTDAKKKTEN